MDSTELLTADVLADILGRLAPRWLAASRCVRKSWRAAIDDRGLLRADLLPLSMSGTFFVPHDAEFPPYLSRSPHELAGADFRYLDGEYVCFIISDHCNGLLLVDDDLMVNPATRQCARLPPLPDPPPCTRHKISYRCNVKEYLAFDPAISPHYEVFLIHKSARVSCNSAEDHGEAEWPPSAYALRVYSSSIRRWEMRTFIREGDAAGAIADMAPDGRRRWYYSAYWRGSLYVRQHDFVMRITSSNNTYRVTKLPKCTSSLETDTISVSDYHLGKSKKGVYCALVVSRYKLWIWLLDESCGKLEWMPMKDVNLEHLLANLPMKQIDGPWRQNVHSRTNQALREEELEWDSDDDDNSSRTPEGTKDTLPSCGVSIVGFHPGKEIVFLLTSIKYRVLAYHVNSSRIEDLGRLSVMHDIVSSFPFTPCRMGDL